MGAVEWLLAGAIFCGFAFFVLRPDSYGRRRSNDSGGGDVGTIHLGGHRSDDRTNDNDSDGGSDGGDGGGGGD